MVPVTVQFKQYATVHNSTQQYSQPDKQVTCQSLQDYLSNWFFLSLSIFVTTTFLAPPLAPDGFSSGAYREDVVADPGKCCRPEPAPGEKVLPMLHSPLWLLAGGMH